MKQGVLAVAFACALAPALAAAQADPFRAIDRNQDGALTANEWYTQDPAPVPFSMVDLDNDERISPAEFQEWRAARGGAMEAGITTADRFRLADRNKDRVISAEEWKDRFPFVAIEAVDADRDQRVSGEEFTAWDRQRGGAMATAAPGGAMADLTAERLRTLDAMRGAAGVSGPTGLPGPAGVIPSNSAPASVGTPGTVTVPRVTPETSPITGGLSTSPGSAPGSMTPPLGTGSGLTTR